jgi:hypothetical protein
MTALWQGGRETGEGKEEEEENDREGGRGGRERECEHEKGVLGRWS